MFGDPYFSFQKQILSTIIATLSNNEQKINVGSLKKNQDFCPRDMESCHLAAARRMKLWSLNANLFFKERQQLTKFTSWSPLKQSLVENISLQRRNCNLFGLIDTVALFDKKSRIFSDLAPPPPPPPIFFTFLTSLSHQLSIVKFGERRDVFVNTDAK